jgi:soluble lytic murein transglycosylase-like protein
MSSARAEDALQLCAARLIACLTGSPPEDPSIPSKRTVWSQLAIALGCTAAIGAAVSLTSPFYVSREPIAAQLIEHKYVDPNADRAPWLTGSTEAALATPRFLLDRELFVMDLLRTGKLNQKRARSLADVAVREAYTRKVPPALVLGVMLTENDELKSSARSNVGAVGLMQVHPRPWRGLSRKFGSNIRTDSTNLKYGIFILGWVAETASKLVGDQDTAWRKALLRYNGCVRGTNTKGCKAYPDVVRREVERSARSSCRGEDFDHCVVEPMWLARRDTAAAVEAPAADTAVALQNP